MILVSHMAFPNGQVFPVKRICAMARKRGVLTVVDGAHSFAHVGPKVADIGCDFYGTSLHKWLGAPMGTGMLWIRPELVSSVWPLFYCADPKSKEMTKFEHYGSHPVPIVLSIAEAAAFHEAIGFKRINARLHFLKKWWVERVRGLPGLELVSNPSPDHTCSLASFTIKGKTGSDIYGYLWNEHKILTTPIGGGDAGCHRYDHSDGYKHADAHADRNRNHYGHADPDRDAAYHIRAGDHAGRDAHGGSDSNARCNAYPHASADAHHHRHRHHHA
jgi:selenocysteine lyase/cysteine desulfurase